MASTYSTNLGIELPGTGDQAGVWGNTTNTNLGTLIEQAISGYVTQAVATGTDTTITIPNGATGVARNMYIELTGTGGASTNLIVPANKKLYFIFNNTSSGQVTVKVSGQTGISVPNGKKMILVSNGTDIVTAENYVASLSTDNLSLTGNLTLSGGTANGVLYLNGSKVATSGSALVFDGTNFGVGTASPAARLHVQLEAAAETDIARFRVTNGANNHFLDIGADEPNKLVIFDSTGSAAGGYVFRGGGALRMAIDVSGNLGLGVTPQTINNVAGYKAFEVASGGFALYSGTNQSLLSTNVKWDGGTAKYSVSNFATLYNQQSGAHSWSTAPSGTAGNAISFTQAMTLDASGRLGIGTSSPQRPLHVFNNNAAVGEYTVILQGAQGGYGAGVSFQSVLQGTGTLAEMCRITADGESAWDGTAANQDANLRFYTALDGSVTEKMRLMAAGNFGLGTTSPNRSAFDANARVLTVYGPNRGFLELGSQSPINSDTLGGLEFLSSTTKKGFLRCVLDGSSNGSLQFAANGSTAQMVLDPSGNLGIGTASPGVRLDVLASSSPNPIRLTSGAGTSIRFDTTRSFTVNRNWLVGCDYISEGLFSIIPSTALGGGAFTTPALSVSSAGEVLIATTSVTQGVSTAETSVVARGKDTTNTSASFVTVSYNGSGVGFIGTSGTTGETFVYAKSNHALVLGTNSAERGRFTAGGYFKASSNGTYVGSTGLYHELVQTVGATTAVEILWNNATSGDNIFLAFQTDANQQRGTIDYNRAGGLVRYNTTSDYRAKEVYGLLDDSGETIDALKVYRGKMHGATMERPMLIAHEAQEVAPYAVTGEKDAVNDDGNPIYQQMDTSSLVPLLIAEIQSLRSRVAALEAQ